MKLTEQLTLLLATAFLTGIVAPYVLKSVDHRRSKEQQISDEAKARQNAIIQAQERLLDEIGSLFWEIRYAIIRLTYYGTKVEMETDAQARFEQAFTDYHERLWPLLHQIRVRVSTSRRLASENCYQQLLSLYERFIETDRELAKAQRMEVPQRRIAYLDMNSAIYHDLTMRIDDVLDGLACELRLKI